LKGRVVPAHAQTCPMQGWHVQAAHMVPGIEEEGVSGVFL